MPFSVLLGLIEFLSPRGTPQGGRPPYPPEVMLPIHLMQNWHSLSGAAMENELIDIGCIRRLAGIDLVTDHTPDAIAVQHLARNTLQRSFIW